MLIQPQSLLGALPSSPLLPPAYANSTNPSLALQEAFGSVVSPRFLLPDDRDRGICQCRCGVADSTSLGFQLSLSLSFSHFSAVGSTVLDTNTPAETFLTNTGGKCSSLMPRLSEYVLYMSEHRSFSAQAVVLAKGQARC